MATKISKRKKPSALVLQEQLNAILPDILGDRLRRLIDQAETQVTQSGIPASSAPKALAEIVDESLEDVESILQALLEVVNGLKPEAIQESLKKFRK